MLGACAEELHDVGSIHLLHSLGINTQNAMTMTNLATRRAVIEVGRIGKSSSFAYMPC